MPVRRCVAGVIHLLRRIWDDGVDWCFLVGAGLISAGAWDVSEPLGKVVLGLFCLLACFLLAHSARAPSRR